ncbi:MAG: DUF1684 domain-containing protein [Woeseiaceae bacterium]|nr:DUF1684 domain-containing protein [Woeseiaceae bacterium]
MTKLTGYVGVIALLLTASGCGRAEPTLDPVAHEAEIMEWRGGRLERLMQPTGYLTQVGLYWIEDGGYTIGSDAGSDIRLPKSADLYIGDLLVKGDQIRLTVENAVRVTHQGNVVSDILMPPDTSGENVMVEHGSIAWSVIERGGKLAVRVRDYEHPWLETFGPLPYYDINPKWRLQAQLHRYDEPRVITVNTVIEGFQQNPVSPGTVTFTVDGIEYELEAQSSGERLFFVFGDETNRGETYGAGRYLYADAPGKDGEFVLDFNMAYSPPCAFNDFSTCPVASPRNRLQVRIDAGELYDPALHYSADAAH